MFYFAAAVSTLVGGEVAVCCVGFVFPELPVERSSRNTQDHGGAFAIATSFVEHAKDMTSFELIERGCSHVKF